MAVAGLVRGWALGVCFGVLCLGQIHSPGQSAPGQVAPGQMRTVSGTVVNSVTGEPISHALVQVFGSENAAVFTGADGRFEIPNIPKQPINATARKPGYTGARHMIPYGPDENNLTLKLTPDAGIHGRVTSDQGEPVEGIQVQAFGEQIAGGRKQERMASIATTDENGEYDLDSLAPGNYFLRTQQRPLYRMSVALPAAQVAYPAEFYPDAPDRASAQAVKVLPGQTAEADFALKLIPTFRVSGAIGGAGNGGIFVNMSGSDGEETSTPVQFNPRTGRFTLTAVPAGSWTFTFRARGGNNPANFAYAETQLDVKSNLSNVVLALQPVLPIPVNIVHAADSARGPQPVVQLIPRGGASLLSRGIYMARPPQAELQAQSAPPDTLEIRDIPPGRYQVAVRTFALNECLDTITSGSTDLMHTDLTVTEGAPPQPITVSLRNDCATVDGTVRAEGVTGLVYVLLVPDSGVGDPVVRPAQPNGMFTFSGIRPDTYHVYAVPEIEDLEYTNPEALRGLSGQEITVSANQKAAVTLDLAAAGGSQ
ncbi:MAG TPA: carboxypeptidase regulatory-like domain-containing protein [Bryobacteraceae bacterium]|jgi:hypothetical protein|nr:carboxypeptidase regulatory-like domain-containing protein [Bryobacteraceae bacterium]